MEAIMLGGKCSARTQWSLESLCNFSPLYSSPADQSHYRLCQPGSQTDINIGCNQIRQLLFLINVYKTAGSVQAISYVCDIVILDNDVLCLLQTSSAKKYYHITHEKTDSERECMFLVFVLFCCQSPDYIFASMFKKIILGLESA